MQLNLDSQYVNDYWKNQDSKFYEFLQRFTILERWNFTDHLMLEIKVDDFVKVAANWTAEIYSKNISECIQATSNMSISQFAYFLQYIDSQFPGLSFALIMDSRQELSNQHSQLLLERVKIINEYNFLQNILSPIRKRLIAGLLSPSDEPEYQLYL